MDKRNKLVLESENKEDKGNSALKRTDIYQVRKSVSKRPSDLFKKLLV